MLSSSLTHLQKIMQTKTYQVGHLLPIWSHSKLLAATRHQSLLAETQQLSGLSEAHFKTLYRPAINKFAEFVQVIPETPQNALGGLLNLGLARAILALRQVSDNKAGFDPLVHYAIFTAGLFFDVAKAMSQQQIVLCDNQGKYLQEWSPFAGSLLEQAAEYYKMYPYHSMTAYDALNHEAAALLARQLMPEEGFLWLSSDLELFIDWLSALRGEQSQEGRKISRALSLIRDEDILVLMKNLPATVIEIITPTELQVEDQFLLWLNEGIHTERIQVNTNEAAVHLLENDVIYLNNEIFKKFLEERKIQTDVNNLAAKVNELFGINVVTAQEKSASISFLSQRGDRDAWVLKTPQGMLAFNGVWALDKTRKFPVSPRQKEINNVFQPARQLPPSVKQVVAGERQVAGNANPNSTFRLR